MNPTLLGVLAALAVTAALFFVRFWKESGDRLFAFFAAGFVMLGADWFIHAMVNASHETQHYLYLLRLGAFVLILAGIISKNSSNNSARR
jgi:hypothetical protein